MGGDLRRAGVPGISEGEVAAYLAPWRARETPTSPTPSSDFWPSIEVRAPTFTGHARRLGPVMVGVPKAAQELLHGWELADALGRLLERWRMLAQCPWADPGFSVQSL